MIGKRTALALLAGGSLLAACGSNNEQTATTDNYILNDAAPYATLTLTPEQQQRRDALNMQAYESEYRGYVDNGGTMPASSATPSPTGTETVSASAMDAGNASDAMGNAGGAMGNSMAANGTMAGGMGRDFASLDRNGDGKLSVAEYAVYAVGLDPNSSAGKPNDQTKPYATADQLNRAADSFFYYDANGDTYLQPDELQAAQAAGGR